jgi:hypothetical protein
MLLAFSGLPVFMAVQAVKSIPSIAYENCVAAAFKPLRVILLSRADSLEFTLSTELLSL